MWTSLADYYIRRGLFERARDVYEEGMTTVVTVHDFSLIFDALTQFEESLLAARMEQLGEEGGAGDSEDPDTFLLQDDQDDLDLRWACVEKSVPMEHVDACWADAVYGRDDGGQGHHASSHIRLARLEHLMERRPLLLSSVVLRQNPHNVHEWHKRAKLFKDNPTKKILAYTEAVKTVDPEKVRPCHCVAFVLQVSVRMLTVCCCVVTYYVRHVNALTSKPSPQATGKPFTLWLAFAKVYETHGDLDNARVIFEKATAAQHKYLDDLAAVWAEWAEMELRHNNFKRALDLMRRATLTPEHLPSRQVRGVLVWRHAGAWHRRNNVVEMSSGDVL